MNDAKKTELRQGEVVLVILVVVNLIEFWFSQVIKSVPIQFVSMMLLAAIDSAIIIEYYMHIWRLVAPEKERH
jgi:hypothetical protein